MVGKKKLFKWVVDTKWLLTLLKYLSTLLASEEILHFSTKRQFKNYQNPKHAKRFDRYLNISRGGRGLISPGVTPRKLQN